MNVKRLFLVMILVLFFWQSAVFGYTWEEQMIYDNLFLQLPWEPAKYKLLTQENRNDCGDPYCTHKTSTIDEYALDFGLSSGTPVRAAYPGVAYIYNQNGTSAPAYGNHVRIEHGYFYTLYAHLSSFELSSQCTGGCEVARGEVIGYAGSTGTSSGSHLHFGLYHGHAWEDGYKYSVESKIVVGHQGVGPYQVLSSTNFEAWGQYLSANFQYGEEGVIICDENNQNCYIDTNTSYVGGYIGGYDTGDLGTTPDGPDANVKTVEIDATGNNWHHSYTADPGQQLEVRVKVTNKGDETIDYFEVFIHRSPDLDFDEDTDYSYGREEEEDDLDPGESDHKQRTITAPTTPGTYYIFAYINRVDGEENGEDQDWSNNISRNDDPEEYAVLTVVAQSESPDAPQNFRAVE